MNNFKHDPAHKGIFVQRNLNYKYPTGKYRKPFCVTFPRLANVLDNEKICDVIFPSQDFGTFLKAFDFAKAFKEMDSRLRACPIYLFDFKWIKSGANRSFQRIG